MDAALQRARDAIRVADAQFGHEVANAYAGRARLTVAMALAARGQAREARVELELAATALETAVGADHPWARDARARLAALSPS